MNTQPRLQQEQQPEPPEPPIVIEQYRGPLLDQLREQEVDAKLIEQLAEPPIAYEDGQPTQQSAVERTLIWLMVRLLNLRDRISGGWRWLTKPFRTSDTILNWARIGILFQLIGVALLILYGLAIGLSLNLLPILQFIIVRTVAPSFYLVGLFNSTRAAVLHSRARQPRTALVLGLIPYFALVVCLLIILGFLR